MSALNFLFNCIIFLVAIQEILSTTLSLPDGYHYTPRIGMHKFHTEGRNWNDARKVCIAEGGHLAIINSEAEERALLDIYHNAGPITGANYTHEAFIGVHDQFAEGEYTTVLDFSVEKAGFNKWTDKWGGQPDNGGGNQNCIVLFIEGLLDDTFCHYLLPFICELPISQSVMDSLCLDTR